MGLEATMICLDNSEWSRNGDYTPTRFQAQSESVHFIANAKINENQESTVGLLSMAGKRIEVHVSPCRSAGALMTAINKYVRIGGSTNFLGALKTAQLALKNRQNKNQRQRIIMFVASPIDDDVKELVKLGKNFKKNNVALDVINFGTENSTNENAEKLEQLMNAVNSSDNSHLVNIPPGPHILADLIVSSPIVAGENAGAAGAMGAAGGDFDPNMDPEMAMAIRMSMEEERERQQRAGGGAAASTGGDVAAAPAGGDAMADDEDALLAQAIALSMQQTSGATAMETDSVPHTSGPLTGGLDAVAHTAGAPVASNSAEELGDMGAAISDPDFINSLLASVPGVGGENVDSLLEQLTNQNQSGTNANQSTEQKKDGDKDKDTEMK